MVNYLPDPRSSEGQELARMLTPNEMILAVGDYKVHIIGVFGAQSYDLHHYLIATSLRVITIKPKQVMKGITSRSLVPSSYFYRDISSVDMQEVGFSKYVPNIGFVRLNIRGNETYRVGEGWRVSVEKPVDPWLPNIAQFGRTDEYRWVFRYVVDVINQQIALAHAPPPPPQPAAPSIPEQIQQLAALRDANIISLQEFEAKKAELLSRM